MFNVLKSFLDLVRRFWWAITGRRATEHEFHAATQASPVGPAPGVGLCLSGGGSRALTAGLGQLRALAHLQVDDSPLLSQVSALSTVSGGSWLGVPWTYLQGATTDDDYLNGYVARPGDLVLTASDQTDPAAEIDSLPAGSPGRNIGGHFAVEDLILQTIVLRLWHGTPWDMMWQILIARHLLHPYGLYKSGENAEPTSFFTLDDDALKSDILATNPRLKHKTAHLVASAANEGRMTRPFLICNTALFVKGDEEFEYLAPVQATPLFTGIWGAPSGVDANDRTPGGGGVTSFAFSSDLTSRTGDRAVVGQTRQFSLTDIVGLSSAAFAETLQNFLESAKPEEVHQLITDKRVQLVEHMQPHLEPHERQGLIGFLEKLAVGAVEDVLRDLDPKALIPKYKYWPVADQSAEPVVTPTRFADAGSLENTGIAGMLAYDQIHSIISCVNAGDALAVGTDGILQISGQVPVLFGLQPYQPDHGYLPYEGADVVGLGANRIHRHNQVFESNRFDDLLAGLTTAAGQDVSTGPAIFKQTLTTVDNAWFGVKGGRKVEVVWCVLNPVRDWTDQLRPEVSDVVSALDGFPNYSTFDTQLTPQQVNLMSNQTAWCIANDANKSDFIELFSRSRS